ncbi:glycosyl transferase [Shewanella sp.]|uniref:glycosyl transferase n=1 Tax=Shewanella sp. TaxID=50422 RepID=UPI0035665150
MPNIGELSLTSVAEFDFRLLIKALGKGEKGSRSLSFAEASLLIQGFAQAKVTPVQMASAMMLMRVRGETVAEVAGVVAGLRHCIDTGWSQLSVEIDWPVYAGKREQLPWLLLVAKLLANNGVRVLLHGDSQALPHRRHVESCIDSLDIVRCKDPLTAKSELDRSGIVYVRAGDLTPVLDACRQLHQELGLRSLIQTAVRCINPANAPLSLRSYFHPGIDKIHQGVSQILFEQHSYQPGVVAVFKGLQGETELNPRVETSISIVNGLQSHIAMTTVDIPTLLTAFSGAKVGQAELSEQALALLWREVTPFDSDAIKALMSCSMIEQALSSVQATLMAILFLLHYKSEDYGSNLTVEQLEKLSLQHWSARLLVTDKADLMVNKEWLCAV